MNTPPDLQEPRIQPKYAPQVRHVPFRIIGGICIGLWGVVLLFVAFYIFLTARDRAWIGIFSQDAANQTNALYIAAAGVILLGFATLAGAGAVFWFLHSDQAAATRNANR